MKINGIKQKISDIGEGLQHRADVQEVIKSTLGGGAWGGAMGLGAGGAVGGLTGFVASYATTAPVETPANVAGLAAMACVVVYSASCGFMEGVERNRHARLLDAAKEAIRKPEFNRSLLEAPIKDFIVATTNRDGSPSPHEGDLVQLGVLFTPAQKWLDQFVWRQATLKDMMSPGTHAGANEVLAHVARFGTLDPRHVTNPSLPGPGGPIDVAHVEQSANRLSGFLRSFSAKNDSEPKSTVRPGM